MTRALAGRILITTAWGTGLFLVGHIAVWRAKPSNTPRVALLCALALAGMAASVAADAARWGFEPVVFWSTLWIEAFLVVVYLFLYSGLARSVSVTLLCRLLGRERVVSFAGLVEEYDRSSRFEDRIRLMADSGLVRCEGDRVTLTPKGDALARWTRRISRSIGDGLGG